MRLTFRAVSFVLFTLFLSIATIAQNQETPRRIRIGGNVQRASLLKQAQPVYPPLAMQARIQGTVRLQVTVSKEGRVVQAEVLSGHPLLVQSALDAVRQWEYRPTLLNGEPVEVVTTVDVLFTLARARNEYLAIGALRLLNTANFAYAATYNRGFAPVLANLGPGIPPTAPPSAAAADLIDAALASGWKAGYNFIYSAGARDADGKISKYTITVEPITPGTTGHRYFFADQSGVIRFSTSGPANAASPPIS